MCWGFVSVSVCLSVWENEVLRLTFPCVLSFSNTSFHCSFLSLSVPPTNGAKSSTTADISVPLSVFLSHKPLSTKKRHAHPVDSTCSPAAAVISSTRVATKKPRRRNRKSEKPSVHSCDCSRLKHMWYKPTIPPADNQCRQCQLASTPTNRLTCTYHEPDYKKKAQTTRGKKCFKIFTKNKNKIKGPRKMSALSAALVATSPL